MPGRWSYCLAKCGTPPNAIHSFPIAVLNSSQYSVPFKLNISIQTTCPEPPYRGLAMLPVPR